jgi:hypothetical protein
LERSPNAIKSGRTAETGTGIDGSKWKGVNLTARNKTAQPMEKLVELLALRFGKPEEKRRRATPQRAQSERADIP